MNDYLNEQEQFKLSKIFMKQLGFDFSREELTKAYIALLEKGTQDVELQLDLVKTIHFHVLML